MRQAGWLKRNAAKRTHEALSLIARCTPSLTHGLIDDRDKTREEKDCNCCHYKPGLMQRHAHQHKVTGDATHYLRVVVGKARGKSISEYAHRLMCYAWHGTPASTHQIVRHLCSNRGGRCVNPYHLQWDTVTANNADVHALIKERTRSHAQGLAAQGLLEMATTAH